MFSWHTLDPLVPIGHCLNVTAYLSIVSDHVHPFMATMYPTSDGYFQQITSNWFLEHDKVFTVLKWPPQSFISCTPCRYTVVHSNAIHLIGICE